MTALAVARPGNTTTRYSLRLAEGLTVLRAAQRLRHLVFAEELGATLHSPEPGLDVDEFDMYCDHLVIVDEVSGAVVGTYRLLPPTRAVCVGRLYSEGECSSQPSTPAPRWFR